MEFTGKKKWKSTKKNKNNNNKVEHNAKNGIDMCGYPNTNRLFPGFFPRKGDKNPLCLYDDRGIRKVIYISEQERDWQNYLLLQVERLGKANTNRSSSCTHSRSKGCEIRGGHFIKSSNPRYLLVVPVIAVVRVFLCFSV